MENVIYTYNFSSPSTTAAGIHVLAVRRGDDHAAKENGLLRHVEARDGLVRRQQELRWGPLLQTLWECGRRAGGELQCRSYSF